MTRSAIGRVTAGFLLLAWSPTPAAHNWITTPILIILAAVGLEVLRRQTAREFPASEYPRKL